MEDLMTFTEAALICPSKVSPQALSRWRRVGVKTRSGVNAYLKCCRSGKQYFTSELWLREFFNRIAELDHIEAEPVQVVVSQNSASIRKQLIAEGLAK